MATRRITIDLEVDSDGLFEEIDIQEYVDAIQDACDAVEAKAMGAPAVSITVKANG